MASKNLSPRRPSPTPTHRSTDRARTTAPTPVPVSARDQLRPEKNHHFRTEPAAVQRLVSGLRLLLVVAAGLSAAGCYEHPLDEILAHVRTAVGVADRGLETPGIEARGTICQAGECGDYRLVFELPSSVPPGSVREEADLRLGHVVVLRGSEAWISDWSEGTRRLLLGELEQQRLRLGFLSGLWLTPDSGFEVAKHSESATQVQLILEIPGGRRAATVTVDTGSWLPRSLSYPTNAGEITWVLSDYRPAAGLRLAHRIDRDWQGPEDSVTLSSISSAEASPASLFELPPPDLQDYRFDRELPPEVGIRLGDYGHVLIRPVIDGREIGWFILDTGADCHVISPRAADALGLQAFAQVLATGTSGSILVGLRQAREMRVGPLTLDDPVFAVIDLSDVIPGVAGVVGYPLFRRSVVELNPGGAPARLFPPGSYPREVDDWHEVVLARRKLFLRGRFAGGHEGLFMLDTGARRGLIFTARFVRELRLLDGRKTWKTRSARGVGGRTPMREGALGWFELGGVRFHEPIVAFALGQEGGHADPYSMGSVGMGFLKHCQVVFNVPESKVAFFAAGGEP